MHVDATVRLLLQCACVTTAVFSAVCYRYLSYVVYCVLVLQGGFVDVPDKQILLLLPDSCDVMPKLSKLIGLDVYLIFVAIVFIIASIKLLIIVVIKSLYDYC